MDDGSCCGKVVLSYVSAAFIALVLLIDVSTTYSDGPGEAMVAMFPGTAQVTAAVVYILALLIYPLLPTRKSWFISIIAIAAAFYSAWGIAVSLVIMPFVSGILAVLYLSPAGLILLLSAFQIFSEFKVHRQTA